MKELGLLVTRYANTGARIKDLRGPGGGRLWVENSGGSDLFEKALTAWGFQWSAKRAAWYYPDKQ